MVYTPNPADPQLTESDLYLIHRAHLAVDALIGELGRRWGRDTTPVLMLRATASELRDIFFSESSPQQCDAMSVAVAEERQANDRLLLAGVRAMKWKPKPA